MANLEVLALDEATPQIRAPGSGDGYVMPRPLTLTTGTITTDIKQVDGTVTWNASGVTFTAWKLNATDTASASGSLLVDLQVGGVSKAKIDKTGGLYLSGPSSGKALIYGTAQYREISLALGLDINGGQSIAYGNAAGSAFYSAMNAAGFTTFSTGRYCFGSSTISSAPDVILYRDAAATLAQRDGTNAQTSRLYRTYTDSSNYQRLTQTWSTSTAVIHNEGAGTGADGSVAFNDAALATNATKGFVMIPSCAGTPTGTPADIPTGQVPIVFDSTNNKLYVYDGGWLATAALT